MVNNLAFNNAEANFQFTAAGPVFYNNCSLYTSGTGVNDRYGGASGAPTGATNCFWLTGSSTRGPSINDAGISISAASFVALTPPTVWPRRRDGGLTLGNFARPVAGHRLINGGALPAGVVLPYDLAWYNSTPDIGLVEVRTGFQLWREQQFGEDALALPHTASTATPASDGQPNIFKYLLGLDAAAPVPATLLPVLTQDGGGFTYHWRRLTTAADVTAAPFTSTDLAAWNSLTPALLSTVAGIQEWTAPAPAAPRRFFRLSLTPN